jgi:Gnt-I system low-affinity gluconate transporter
MIHIFAQATAMTPSVGYLLTCVAISIVVLFAMIIFARIHAFLALIFVSMLLALLSGMDLLAIGGSIQKGMGNSLGFIATVVGLGAIFGKILEASGGAEAIAQSLIKKFGESRSTWALTVTGFLISIPVFLDVGLVLVAPLLFALARDAKRSVLYFAFPLLAGMVVTHACIPPTPGPIAVAELLQAELGLVVLFGVIVGLPTAVLCGPLLGVWLSKTIDPADLQQVDDLVGETSVDSTKSEMMEAPTFGLILMVIGLPLVLMVGGSVIDSMRRAEAFELVAQADGAVAPSLEVIAEAQKNPELFFNAGFWKLFSFLGHPFVALLIATFVAWYVLGIQRGFSAADLMDLSTASLAPAGVIILVTGAGGVFKTVLSDSGAAQAMAKTLVDLDLPLLVLAWVIAAMIRLIQGSATVAMITSAGLLAGMIAGLPEPVSANEMALLVLAIAFGASIGSHLNDSGFWLVSRYLGMSERQTFRTWTILTTVISLVGFGLTLFVGKLI